MLVDALKDMRVALSVSLTTGIFEQIAKNSVHPRQPNQSVSRWLSRIRTAV